MIGLNKSGFVLAALAATLTYGNAAHADYFVRPYAGFSTGTVLDGLQVNGVTANTVGFSDSARSANATVDLATGTLKGYAAQNVDGFSYFNSIMGERITLRGGAGTQWDFDFSLDGDISAALGQEVSGNNSSTNVGYALTFAVYRPGEVTYLNWASQASQSQALFFQDQQQTFTFPGNVDPSGPILKNIHGSLALQTNEEVFEIYARIFASAGANMATGLVSSVVDLSHTGTISLDFDDRVSAYSDSGVFLGLGRDPGAINDVPEPGSLALVLAGLIGLMGVARKRRT